MSISADIHHRIFRGSLKSMAENRPLPVKTCRLCAGTGSWMIFSRARPLQTFSCQAGIAHPAYDGVSAFISSNIFRCIVLHGITHTSRQITDYLPVRLASPTGSMALRIRCPALRVAEGSILFGKGSTRQYYIRILSSLGQRRCPALPGIPTSPGRLLHDSDQDRSSSGFPRLQSGPSSDLHKPCLWYQSS